MAVDLSAVTIVAGIIVNVIAFDAFKALCVALGLTVLYAASKQGDGKMFRAVGTGKGFEIFYDADIQPATFTTDLPDAKLVDTIDPS